MLASSGDPYHEVSQRVSSRWSTAPHAPAGTSAARSATSSWNASCPVISNAAWAFRSSATRGKEIHDEESCHSQPRLACAHGRVGRRTAAARVQRHGRGRTGQGIGQRSLPHLQRAIPDSRGHASCGHLRVHHRRTVGRAGQQCRPLRSSMRRSSPCRLRRWSLAINTRWCSSEPARPYRRASQSGSCRTGPRALKCGIRRARRQASARRCCRSGTGWPDRLGA